MNKNKLKNNERKDDIKKSFMSIYSENNNVVPSASEFMKLSGFSRYIIQSCYGVKGYYDKLIDDCNIEIKNSIRGKKSNKNILKYEIQRFVKEFDRVPITKDFERLKGYPSRKTFTNYYGSFNDAIRDAGFEPVGISRKENNEFCNDPSSKDVIARYLQLLAMEIGKSPTIEDLERDGKYSRNTIKKVFVGYNDALSYANLTLNSPTHHSDEFLKTEFERFVTLNGRIPMLLEFNNSEYPSFWCYQNRFGTWNKAVMAYGYEPSDIDRKYYMDDGEICCSSYEFEVSKWLKKNDIEYVRNVRYDSIVPSYKGKMDCDYEIHINGNIYYVEVAGLLPRYGLKFDKWSSMEKNYFFKMKYKEKIMDTNDLNKIILKPHRFKDNTWIEKLTMELKLKEEL